MTNTGTKSEALPRLRKGHLTDLELNAAFLAAREYGKILDDDVLSAIVSAVLETTEKLGD